MSHARPSIVSPATLEALASIGAGWISLDARLLDRAVDGLGALPADAAPRCETQIVHVAQLHLDARRPLMPLLMRRWPRLAWLLLFHRSGYLREAALRAIEGPAPSPFWLAAVAMRLNDWVPEVRAAAVVAAERTLAVTAAAVVAETAVRIGAQIHRWRRWHGEIDVLTAAFDRPDVVEAIADLLQRGTVGGLGRALRAALRRPALDPHLLRLATSARLAEVRASALRPLIAREATWIVGYERVWVNKVYGQWRTEPVLARRPIEGTVVPVDDLIRAGARDAASSVRRVVAASLFDASLAPDLVREIAALLANDRSASIRARAAFLLRR